MKKKERIKRKKKVSIANIILTVILIAGLGVMLYPTVSDWWNARHASRAIASYVEAVDNMDEENRQAMLEAAKQYNASLARGIHFTLSDEEYEEYEELLDLTGTGIMGYIEIPSINVDLPVYHGVEEAVLQVAVGHIPGSSLPVGGEGSHCILSGHRGLPSARLFTDLDRVKEGDTFSITVLNEVFTYEVDQIRIVLPHEVDELAIVPGMDYCTLVTCTPYGINSHRMLVRGHRIESVGDAPVIVVNADAQQIPSYYVIPAVGIPLLFVVLVVMLIVSGRRKPKKTGEELLEEFKKHKDHK